MDLVRPSGVVSQHRDNLRNVFVQDRVVRLATVPCVDRSKDGLVPLAQVCELPQQEAPARRSHRPPFARLQGSSCGCHCEVDIFWSGGRYFCDSGLIIGIRGPKGLSGNRRDELVVYKKPFYR